MIVATGAHRIAKLPDFASELDPRIVQMHSSEYRDPSQFAEGDVLVVGAGNSGAEIAYELVETRRCLLAGKSSGQIPVPHGSLRFRPGFRVFRFFMHRIARVDTRIGRKLGPELLAHADPLIRRREKDLEAPASSAWSGSRASRTACRCSRTGASSTSRTSSGAPGSGTTSAGSTCRSSTRTGSLSTTAASSSRSRGSTSWGSSSSTRSSSDVLPGRGRDARYIAKHIAARKREAAAVEPAEALAAA